MTGQNQHSRAQSYKIYDQSYIEIGCMGDPCVYCGVAADSYDHIPPLVIISRTSIEQRGQFRLKKVPACIECNQLLSGANVLTLSERRKLVRKKLKRRYQKLLNIPQWDEEDLAGLGKTLALDVATHAKRAEWVKSRLNYYSPNGPAIDGEHQ